MNKIYLLLGSNMGDSAEQLATAIHHIKKETGKLIRQSARYTTAAWGNTNQPDFLNQVAEIKTTFTANETLLNILTIEKKMGRVRTVKNAPRIIDIDMLFFNNEIINRPDLKIPHPEIQNRRFVLVPMNELSPGFIHPVLHKSIYSLLMECKDPLSVNKF